VSLTPRMPRRWNVEIDGINWLARLSDKARMSRGGVLGSYLLGHSPTDRALLTRLAMTTDEFVTLATAAQDDAALIAALRARGFDEARVRRWSDRFESTYRFYIPLWDLDEGYRTPSRIEKPLVPLMRAMEGPVMALVRRVLPKP
jgi:hypothetical protein